MSTSAPARTAGRRASGVELPTVHRYGHPKFGLGPKSRQGEAGQPWSKPRAGRTGWGCTAPPTLNQRRWRRSAGTAVSPGGGPKASKNPEGDLEVHAVKTPTGRQLSSTKLSAGKIHGRACRGGWQGHATAERRRTPGHRSRESSNARPYNPRSSASRLGGCSTKLRSSNLEVGGREPREARADRGAQRRRNP